MALYGAVIGLIGAVHADRQFPDQVQLMPTRSRGIERSIAVLDRGGPPLLGAAPAWAGSTPPPETTYFPVGSDDDPGLYLYVPLIAKILGTDDFLGIVKWIFVSAFALLLCSYPLLFYELFGSIAAALAAPLLALKSFSYLYDTQFYWMPAWVTLALLPVLFVLARRQWKGSVLAAVCVLVLLAGVASSFRGGAGIGLVAAACILALLKMPTLGRRLLVVALFLVSYFATSQAVFTGARTYRDHAVGKHVEEFHKTPWHNIYIGLGYIPNKYGIAYSDSVALRAAQRLDPNVDYLGRTYPRTMRRVVWNLARRDPAFILRNLEEKLGTIDRAALDRYLWVIVLVPAMMFMGSSAAERRRWVGLTLPSIAIGAAPPLLVLPLEQYELGWFGAWALLWLLGVLWLIATVEAAAVALAPSSGRLEARDQARLLVNRVVFEAQRLFFRFRRGNLLAWGTVVVVCLILLSTRIPSPGVATAADRNYYLEGQTALLPHSARLGPAAGNWTFSEGIPSRWQVTPGTVVTRRRAAVGVTTTMSRSDYQLEAPVVELRSGAYRGVVQGEIARGGLELGILDVGRDRWIQNSYFSFHQPLRDALMHVEFSVDHPTRVQMILSNWAQEDSRSSWTLRTAAIVRR